MRETEFRHETDPDGRMSFRAYRAFPGEKALGTTDPASDGQCGSIMRLYRDWRLSGDTGWMVGLWPQARLAMEYSINTWDPDEDGVADGRQHNTYDIQFYGPNPLSGVMYLGALRAASKMAEAAGDYEAAERYSTLFEKGRRRLSWPGNSGRNMRSTGGGCRCSSLGFGEVLLVSRSLGGTQPAEHRVDHRAD